MCLVHFEINNEKEKKKKINHVDEGKDKKNLEPNNILLDFVHLTHTRTHVQRVFRYFTASFALLHVFLFISICFFSLSLVFFPTFAYI